MLVDWSLIITIAVIFLITLLGAWLRSRRKDECLRAFGGYHVTLERADNTVIWGALHVCTTGLELLYKDAVQDDQHVESSYVLYGAEFDQIQAIYRYADDLTEENKKRREQDLRRWFHPSPLRYLARKTRNFLTTASESLNEVIGILVGRLRKPAGNYLSETSETYMKKFGGEIIGHVGHSQDPLLERFIGQRVVFELVEDDEVHEHVGIFKNYSADFLEFLDVHFPFKQSLSLHPDCEVSTNRITAIAADRSVRVHNYCDYPVLLQSLRMDDGEEELLNVVVDGGEEVKLFPGRKFQDASLQIKIIRELDMIVPRSRAVVRHRAGLFKTTFVPDIIFDLGILLHWGDRITARETRLRRQLERNPNNALAAANLGGLMIKQGKYGEAEKWLSHAVELRESLPDGGRRVQMELRELERRRQERMAPLMLGVTQAPPKNGDKP
jgi:hypothetical protein